MRGGVGGGGGWTSNKMSVSKPRSDNGDCSVHITRYWVARGNYNLHVISITAM